MQANPNPKHISELTPTQRAMADQSTRDALLAIVVAQGGKSVTLPIADLTVIADTYRLVVEVDRVAGVVTLKAERAEGLVLQG